MNSLQFVSWNCLSCYPQYFDEVKAIEKGASNKALQANRLYNAKRYKNTVSILMPHIERISENKLTAILLQEVDFELLQMLKETISRSFRDVYVHFRTPYMIYPHNQPPPHQFSYFLVTIHHYHNRSESCSSNPILDRCLVTSLRTCTIYNVHIPWVAPDHSPYKHQRTKQTVWALSRAMRNNETSVLLGDLNMSCEFNVGLYKKYFSQRFYNTHTFGESYKLSPENVLKRKTFKLLEHTTDDGCIVHSCYALSSQFNSLGKKQLPIDHTGWFIKQTNSSYPSDHALAQVDCIPVSKRSRQTHTHRKRSIQTLTHKKRSIQIYNKRKYNGRSPTYRNKDKQYRVNPASKRMSRIKRY